RSWKIPREDPGASDPEPLHQRLQLGPERARSDPDQAHVVAGGAADLREGLDEEGGILPRDQGSEGEEHAPARDVPAPGEGLVARPRRVLRPYAAVDDLDVIGADSELLGELALLEHGIEVTRIEMMVMGHHRHGQTIVAPGPQRGRTDEADGVRAQHVELL